MPLLTYILDRRAGINAAISGNIQKRIPDPYLAQEILRCVLPGRKIRSILFLDSLHQLAIQANQPHADDMVFSIEAGHAASVLVDDVLDGDAYRHGRKSAESEWGIEKSVLFAHFLAAAAIENLEFDSRIQQEFVRVYRSMTHGEMYDVFLPPGQWVNEGYDYRVQRKTSEMFRFSLWSAGTLSGVANAAESLADLGSSLGILYQLSNDFFDWQPDLLDKRHARDQTWPVTFSFPLAVYLRLHGSDAIGTALTKRHLSFEDWLCFLRVIWTNDVREECLSNLAQRREELLGQINVAPVPSRLRRLYSDFIEAVVSEEFWYHVIDSPQI